MEDCLPIYGDDSPLTKFVYHLMRGNVVDAKRIVTREIAHKRDYLGCGFIWYFLFHGKDDPVLLQYLLDQGATLDAPKTQGYYSPLQQATCYGKEKVLRELLNIGVGVDVYLWGCTSLQLAFELRRIENAKILLDAGAKLGLVYADTSIPEWVHGFMEHREHIRKITLIVLGLKRAQSQIIGCNGRNVLCVIARCVWETRGHDNPS